MQKRGHFNAATVDLNFSFPTINELISRAEKITESCVHPQQVVVGRNFLLNVARRGTDSKVYSLNDLEMVRVLVDHMANRQTTRIYQRDELTALH